MSHPDKPGRPDTAGILVLNKPLHFSSMRVVSVVRAKARGAKTGHAGTLDPLATGVLVLALGRATKIIDRLMDTHKRYRTDIVLDAFTETADLESEPQPIHVERPPTKLNVQRAVETFVGSIQQRPPAHSAIKVDGRRAYQLARKGEQVDLPARSVLVHSMDVIAYDWPRVTLEIRCDKGFYVRSLARDLGEVLGTGGYCASIHRTAVGPFSDAQAIDLNDVPEPLESSHLIAIDDALAMMDRIR